VQGGGVHNGLQYQPSNTTSARCTRYSNVVEGPIPEIIRPFEPYPVYALGYNLERCPPQDHGTNMGNSKSLLPTRRPPDGIPGPLGEHEY
jgi:hypothetical protein